MDRGGLKFLNRASNKFSSFCFLAPHGHLFFPSFFLSFFLPCVSALFPCSSSVFLLGSPPSLPSTGHRQHSSAAAATATTYPFLLPPHLKFSPFFPPALLDQPNPTVVDHCHPVASHRYSQSSPATSRPAGASTTSILPPLAVESLMGWEEENLNSINLSVIALLINFMISSNFEIRNYQFVCLNAIEWLNDI